MDPPQHSSVSPTAPSQPGPVIASAMSWNIEPCVAGGWDEILCWALNQNNESILIRITNWPSTFYFEFADQSRDYDYNDALRFHRRLRSQMGENGKNCLMPLEEDLAVMTKLYYGRKAVMLKLSFTNQDSARHASNILKKGLKLSDSYYSEREYGTCHETENEIDIFRKLLSKTGIKHCGWFQCDARMLTNEVDKISTRKCEYTTRYQTMKPIVLDQVPRPLWFDFDLEVYSHNHDQFPRHWNSKDVIHTASVVLRRDGASPDTWKKYVVTSYPYIIEDEDIADVVIFQVDTEDELNAKFASLMVELDPDLISGYNIMMFDNKYMDARIMRMNDSWPLMGRLKGRAGVAKNISWASNAYKEKDIYIPCNPGRQYLDMFEHITRSMQLGSYSLENVARAIFPDDKTKRKQDVSPKKQFEIYKAVQDVRKDGRLDAFYDAEEAEPGSGSDEVYQILVNAGKLIRYCVFDSLIVGYIANKIHFWISTWAMCNNAGCQPQDLLTRGQQHKVSSLLYHDCQAFGIVRDKQHDLPQFYYRGGLVQQPVVGHSEQIMLMDFQSLYPNVMKAHNLCYTTFIPDEDWDLYKPGEYESIPLEICDIDPEKEETKKKGKKQEIEYYVKEVRFLKPHVREGVLPRVLTRLLEARAAVRKEKHTDETAKTVQNQNQLALKINANSIYGFPGVRAGNGKGAKAQMLWLCAATCFLGRRHITDTIAWMEMKYNARLIYGDTDSCMMQIAGGLVGDIYAHARQIAEEASAAQYPLVLEMEGVFDMFCEAQKMYAKTKYKDRSKDQSPGDLETNSKGELYLEVKGLTPARRDSCNWVRETIYTVLLMMMQKKSYYEIVHYVMGRVQDMYDDRFPLSDFVITKGLSSGYKKDNAPMKVFAEEMAQLGLTLEAGQRYEYVVLAIPGVTAVARRMILVSQFDPKKHKIDHSYYFENLLRKKIDGTISAQFGRMQEMEGIKLRVNGKDIDGSQPAKLILQFLRKNMKLSELDKGMYKIGELIEKNKNAEVKTRARVEGDRVLRRRDPK